jgi:hypothetical protein
MNIDIVPCADCKYHKTMKVPLIGRVSGCLNKKVKAVTYMKLYTKGGDCTEKPGA